MLSTFKALWATSIALQRKGHWNNPAHFARLWFHGLTNHQLVSYVYTHTGFGNTARIIAEEPDFFGILVWPLIDKRWGVSRRLREVVNHYREAAAVGDLFDLRPEETKTLLALSSIFPQLTLRLERQPRRRPRSGARVWTATRAMAGGARSLLAALPPRRWVR